MCVSNLYESMIPDATLGLVHRFMLLGLTVDTPAKGTSPCSYQLNQGDYWYPLWGEVLHVLHETPDVTPCRTPPPQGAHVGLVHRFIRFLGRLRVAAVPVDLQLWSIQCVLFSLCDPGLHHFMHTVLRGVCCQLLDVCSLPSSCMVFVQCMCRRIA